ncbi:MAG: NAD(P)H-hydrate dehydratase [candidate division WOR-3 bacterium]|nr:MAG: NAD(P)H-hydrate dehydratase [candidate division WOR-3 bacterium]
MPMQRIVTAAQMSRLDSKAVEECGIPGMVLMENAGRSVCDSIQDRFERLAGLEVAVVCGKGNNGGDGFVVTRHLLNRGADVNCFLLGRVAELKGDARANADVLLKAGTTIEEVANEDRLVRAFESCALVVDAVLGTGLDSAPRGLFAGAIELINRSGCFVVSVDIPSGVNADTGAAYEPAVAADLTVTMALPKYGHVLFPGRGLCGDVEVADIGIPERLLAEGADTFFVDEDHVADILPERPEHGHKGTFGTALIVAGARGFSGAACLAGTAAVRSGCGLVKLAYPEAVAGPVEANVLEAVKVPLPGTDAGTIAPAALDALLELAQDAECVAIGPGITTNPETAAFQLDLLPRLKCPVIVDADGINNLAGRLDLLSGIGAPSILTPHPGEFARLTGMKPDEVNRDRINVSREFARRHRVVLVLKGAPTVTATPAGEVFVNPTGNSGLGSGGTGDVLTGLMAGLLAQTKEPVHAAVSAVFLHGLAADLAAEDMPERCLAAGDLLDYIPDAFGSVLEPVPAQGPE